MILVTGASGFLGHHLIQHLASRGQQVRALYHTQIPAACRQLPGVEWLQADLLDVYDVEQAMQGITHIYHCAAIVDFNPRNREKMLHFNAESTANVVNQALLQRVAKMVHVSSVAALGRGGAAPEITEDTEWGDSSYNSAYAVSKFMAENEVWRGIGEGLNAVIASPGVVLGPGNWEVGSARLVKVAHSEFPFYTRGATAWVGVADTVAALVRLMESPLVAESYIISSGNYSYREVFTLLAQGMGKKPPHIAAGPLLTGIIWRWNALLSALLGISPAITRETARNAQNISRYSNTKFLQAFPDFTYTPIATTTAEVGKAYMEGVSK